MTDKLTAGDKKGFEGNTMAVPDSITAESIASHTDYGFIMQL
jgi:hypothetical protein